jgi:hypothetical protein
MASDVCSKVGLVAGAVLLICVPALVVAKSGRTAPLASAEDYVMVCQTETPVHVCVELLTSTDLRSGVRSARLTYYELDTLASDSRGLSCEISPAALSIGAQGRRLREAALRVTVEPGSPACLGSWGVWGAAPVAFDVGMTPSGGFLQQSKGHGLVQFPEASYRFADATESWSVVAAGSVDGQDFAGASGNIQTLRRTNISKER